MKPKNVLSSLTILWMLVVLLEGAASVIRSFQSRKMCGAARLADGIVGRGKALALIVLAVSNVFLFMKQVEE